VIDGEEAEGFEEVGDGGGLGRGGGGGGGRGGLFGLGAEECRLLEGGAERRGGRRARRAFGCGEGDEAGFVTAIGCGAGSEGRRRGGDPVAARSASKRPFLQIVSASPSFRTAARSGGVPSVDDRGRTWKRFSVRRKAASVRERWRGRRE